MIFQKYSAIHAQRHMCIHTYACVYAHIHEHVYNVFYNMFAESCKWMSKDDALNLLLEVSKSCDRIGPFVVSGILQDSTDGEKWKTSLRFPYQVSFMYFILCCLLLLTCSVWPSLSMQSFHLIKTSIISYLRGISACFILIFSLKITSSISEAHSIIIIICPRPFGHFL